MSSVFLATILGGILLSHDIVLYFTTALMLGAQVWRSNFSRNK